MTRLWLLLPVLIGSVACSSAQIVTSASSAVEDDAGVDAALAHPVRGVVRGRMGGPIVSARVRVGSTVTTTDTMGRFFVPDAPDTYDVVVVAGSRVTVAASLTDRQPLLESDDNGSFSSVPLAIRYPEPQAGTRFVTLQARDGWGTMNVIGHETPGKLETTLYWGDTEPKPQRLVTLGFVANGFGPIERFVGAAQTTMVPVAPLEAAWSPSLEPVETVRVAVDVEAAPGQTVSEAVAALRLEGTTGWGWLHRTVYGGLPSSVLIPKVPGAKLGVALVAWDTGREGSAGGASSSTIVPLREDGTIPPVKIPAAPVVSAPADDATDFGVGSRVEWSGEGTCVATFHPQTMGAPQLAFVVKGTSVIVPDLSDMGITMPKGVKYRWAVRCVNAAADEANVPWNASPTGTVGTSTYRTVTTRE